jgi:hypothetical protein
MNIEQMNIAQKGILTNTDLPLCGNGHRGVGKSDGIMQICHEIGPAIFRCDSGR